MGLAWDGRENCAEIESTNAVAYVEISLFCSNTSIYRVSREKVAIKTKFWWMYLWPQSGCVKALKPKNAPFDQ